jgi:hypothetical protein
LLGRRSRLTLSKLEKLLHFCTFGVPIEEEDRPLKGLLSNECEAEERGFVSNERPELAKWRDSCVKPPRLPRPLWLWCT